MNTAQLDRMRAGREAQLVEQRHAHRQAVAEYRVWLRDEAEAFSMRAGAEAAHTRKSDQFRLADTVWRRLCASMPTPPPDHAWERS